MENIQLKYLLALDHYGSFAKAAEHSFTSHQVIRNAIINLEKELNVKLVVSTNQGTVLTPAGLLVKDFAVKYYDDFKKLQDNLSEYQICSSTTVNISLYMSPMFSSEYYLGLFSDFEQQNSNIVLDMHFSALPQMFEDITSPYAVGLTLILTEQKTLDRFYQMIAQYNLRAFCIAKPQTYYCMHKSSKYAKNKSLCSDMLDQTTLYTFITNNAFCLPNKENSYTFSNKKYAISYFSSFNVLKRILRTQDSVASLHKKEFEHYFGKNLSEYILIPSSEQNTSLMAITCSAKGIPSEVQDLIEFFRTLF